MTVSIRFLLPDKSFGASQRTGLQRPAVADWSRERPGAPADNGERDSPERSLLVAFE